MAVKKITKQKKSAQNLKFWLAIKVLLVTMFVATGLLVLIGLQKSTTPEEAAASYNLTPYLKGVQFTAQDMYVVKNGERVSPPKKGSWSFQVVKQQNGAYPQSPSGILADKRAVTVIGNYQEKGGSGQKMQIRLRFNADDEDWWVNGAFIRRTKNGQNVLATTLQPFYPENKKDEAAWESDVFEQVIGDKIELGEAFEGDINVPLYGLYGTSATSLKEGAHWGTFVIKGARIKAFAESGESE